MTKFLNQEFKNSSHICGSLCNARHRLTQLCSFANNFFRISTNLILITHQSLIWTALMRAAPAWGYTVIKKAFKTPKFPGH